MKFLGRAITRKACRATAAGANSSATHNCWNGGSEQHQSNRFSKISLHHAGPRTNVMVRFCIKVLK